MDNDYFVAEFLLTFPAVGQYSAQVETSLVDGKGAMWSTGQHGIRGPGVWLVCAYPMVE